MLINLCLKINATINPGCTLFNLECTFSAKNTLRIDPDALGVMHATIILTISALEALCDYALYKSTFYLLTYLLTYLYWICK